MIAVRTITEITITEEDIVGLLSVCGIAGQLIEDAQARCARNLNLAATSVGIPSEHFNAAKSFIDSIDALKIDPGEQ